jgi:diacylglycerol kinase
MPNNQTGIVETVNTEIEIVLEPTGAHFHPHHICPQR